MAVLSLADLNRTYLHRQHLLAASPHSTLGTLEHLVGLQAQVSTPPYFGMHSRLPGFEPAHLMDLRDKGEIYRAALLRSTLHWVSARDYFWLRPLLQPALEKAWQGFFGARKSGIEIEPLREATLSVLKPGPLSMSELSDQLLHHFPHWNKEAMEYGARTHVPMVQISPAGTYKGGTAARYKLVQVAANPDAKQIALRYLAAFGPATAKDLAAWAGHTSIGKVLTGMARQLTAYTGPNGETLYDVPGLEIVPGKTPAPVRLAAEYDNLVLAHADRTRVVPEAHRKQVLLTAGRVAATVLIDGFVGGTWKLERSPRSVRLNIELFTEPKPKLRREIDHAAEALLAFAEPGIPAPEVEVRWIV